MTLPHLSWKTLWQLCCVVTLAASAFAFHFGDPDGKIFWHLLSEDVPGAATLLLIFVIAAFLTHPSLDIRGLVTAISRHRFFVATGLWLLLCAGTVFVYRAHPLSMDEYAASFQAAAFSEGRLYGRVAAELVDWVIPKGFQGHFFIVDHHDGRIASGYWPGFALLLAPFFKFGLPWACNPLIVALSLLLIGRLTYDLTGDEKARGWAMLLAIASPGFLVNGLSFYAMPAHLLFNLAFIWLLLDPTPRRILAAATIGSFALVLHNPFPHLLFALPWLAWLTCRRNGGLRNAATLALGYLPLALLMGLGWMVVLSDLYQSATLTQAVSLTTAPHQPWIIRVLTGLLRPFQFPDEMTLIYRSGGLAKLWLWSAPALPLLALLPLGEKKSGTFIKLMAASFLFTQAGYFLLPVGQGHGWGDRYGHSAWGVLPILAAVWISRLPADGDASKRLRAGLAIAAIGSLLLANSLRFIQVGSFMNGHLAQLPVIPKNQTAIVFVRSGYYVMDLVQNDPFLRNRVWIFASRGSHADNALAVRLQPGTCLVAKNIHAHLYSQPDTANARTIDCMPNS